MIPSSFCFPFRSKIHSIYKEIFILWFLTSIQQIFKLEATEDDLKQYQI
jgi:hypothetical protein